ncbi:hypothetical protein RRG08_040629 [Elysia crispata]|uniref:Uncharacterized protein n=1 Tax=Elysia crispata TaxID=231223 RepID=A0AAE1B3E9_9GAST|nr:hypothetical protein RRG08_040629 [Elysia crispata]
MSESRKLSQKGWREEEGGANMNNEPVRARSGSGRSYVNTRNSPGGVYHPPRYLLRSDNGEGVDLTLYGAEYCGYKIDRRSSPYQDLGVSLK